MKKIISIVLTIVMLLSISVFSFADSSTSTGSYSNSNGTVNWTYYADTKTIEFSGTGMLYVGSFDPTSNLDIDNVVINEGFTSIGNTFFEDRAIKTVSIPDTVKSIGGYAFAETDLTEVVIPDSVNVISDYAFYRCYDLEYVTLSDNLEHIGHSVFEASPFLQSLMDDEYCSYAGKYLLRVDSCFGVGDTLTVRYGTTLIAEGVLQDADIKRINIPDTVKYFCEDYTDYDSKDAVDPGVDDIEVVGPSMINSCIDVICFYGTEEQWSKVGFAAPKRSKYRVEILGKEDIFEQTIDELYGFDPEHADCDMSGGYDEDYGKIEWNYDSETKTLTFSGTGKLKLCPWQRDDVEHIVIGEGITQLGHYLFFDMDIKSVTLPDTLETIGVYAFAQTTELKEIDIPENVRIIDCNAFYYSGLESANLQGVTEIKGAAFYKCNALSSVTLPSTLKEIGYDAFYSCESLATIDVPDSVKTIRDYAFAYSGIETISLPDGMKYIGEDIFSGTPFKKTAVLDEGIAFYVGPYLMSIKGYGKIYTVKDGTTLIAKNALITDGSAIDYPAVIHVDIPNTVKYMCDDGFYFYNNGKVGEEYTDNTDLYSVSIDFYGSQIQWDRLYRNPTTRYAIELTVKGQPLIDSSSKFTDIKKSAWYKQYIDYTVFYGIFNGKGDGKFAPESNITRAEFVQVLANLSGVDTTDRQVESGFADVPSNKWYTPAVKWGGENGIVNGMGDGKFSPLEHITREQMCVMLVRYAEFVGITFDEINEQTVFADDEDISDWAKHAVYTCRVADIVNGKGENKFEPLASATRAEAATIFTRYHLDYIA